MYTMFLFCLDLWRGWDLKNSIIKCALLTLVCVWPVTAMQERGNELGKELAGLKRSKEVQKPRVLQILKRFFSIPQNVQYGA